MLRADRQLYLLVILFLSPPASTLGMPHGAATFVGTCSGDKIDCVSEVSVPEILDGKAGTPAGRDGTEWAAQV